MVSVACLFEEEVIRTSTAGTRTLCSRHGLSGMRFCILVFESGDLIVIKELPAYPSLATVEQLILNEKRGNCVPVYVQVPADLITPCMAYLRIAKGSKYSFLLESVIGGESVSRYSFIGAG